MKSSGTSGHNLALGVEWEFPSLGSSSSRGWGRYLREREWNTGKVYEIGEGGRFSKLEHGLYVAGQF